MQVLPREMVYEIIIYRYKHAPDFVMVGKKIMHNNQGN